MDMFEILGISEIRPCLFIRNAKMYKESFYKFIPLA